MIKEMLVELGAIKFGDFTLTSGKKSSYYVDIKIAATNPRFLDEIADEFAKRVRAKTVAGVELGAVPLIVAASMRMKIPYVIIRTEERTHGVKSPIVGTVKEGENIDILEDVVTTGNSVLRAAKLLREKGAVVDRVICVVDREEGGAELLRQSGLELVPIVKISEVLKK